MSTTLAFRSKARADVRRRLSLRAPDDTRDKGVAFAHLTPMWAGIAGGPNEESSQFEVVVSIHDSVYTTDYTSSCISYATPDNREKLAAEIEDHVVQTLQTFEKEHLCKFLGAGVTEVLREATPNLCTRLWLQMDVVPIAFDIKPYHADSARRHGMLSATGSRAPSRDQSPTPNIAADVRANTGVTQYHQSLGVPVPAQVGVQQQRIPRTLDEQADSAARKCVMHFGPNNNPRLFIEGHNRVGVDAAGKIRLLDSAEDYRASVRPGTWNAVTRLAASLREKKVKIGFFSSTPQGGGVALMRHALVRFLKLLSVDVAWYVPNPSPAVFRIMKNNHNILQGVAKPDVVFSADDKRTFDAWIHKNGLRWTARGGPLAEGGVDVAFIDDPQMPGLIPLIRKVRPGIPIVYRSHIEIRSDLVGVAGSQQENVWKYLWNNIQDADLFISHPVSKFVPDDVPMEKVALLPAATDWLDGLNKELAPWDSQYYMGEFRALCAKEKMTELRWPERDYIVQVARFDPSKGIPSVIESYVKLRKSLDEMGYPAAQQPQLLICGHGAVDDPDASIIYDQVMGLVASDDVSKYQEDIVVMRVPPSDQILNALLSNAKIALQLSTREGFEVKVSEALHAGIPVVASRSGGIPLQIEDGKSGYLTEPGDCDAVARHLLDLYTNTELYDRMSVYAKSHVSDEVSTLGNAAAWMYLAHMYANGKKVTPNGAWLNDLMREEIGEPYVAGEPRLPRGGLEMKG